MNRTAKGLRKSVENDALSRPIKSHAAERTADEAKIRTATQRRSTKFERRCYELPRDAYVKARYSWHRPISDELLAWLSARVELLQSIVRELCEARIAELAETA